MSQNNRKKTRKFLMQKLYARIYGEVDTGLFYDSYFEGILDFDIDREYLDEMFELVIENQEEVVAIIKKYAPKFDLETMLKTNILAMGICITELLYLKEEIPTKVSINEAIELSKYFGDDSCKKIVNGILNAFLENIANHFGDTKVELATDKKVHFFI